MASPGSVRRNQDVPAPLEPSLAALAARQHGVVSVAQLRQLGFDKFAVNRRASEGWLHSMYRGVYSVGHASVSMPGRYLAAVLACGPGAALSHRAAANLWGLRLSPAPAEVTVPRGRVGRPGISVHPSRILAPNEFTVLDEIPITTVARTLLDLAALFPERDLARVLDRAERLDLFDLAAV